MSNTAGNYSGLVQNREQQDRMIEILKFKLDVLWTMADAMLYGLYYNYAPYF